ncbi:hypothetical protein BTK96_004634 [Burkholderia pyrrocinia]|uniref:hypothetical protein n=1 Tax=Burkholderia sp. IT-111MI5 TaxID=3026439 RepID=UPI002A2662DB|nr:hypothetical protein [Burkholderia pyrrocinia]EKS9896121.1 hypothetical protein [Burkholderia pyrrocinia]EKS9909154.1 hypothetical protein [Burkholderia pyrrocinia]
MRLPILVSRVLAGGLLAVAVTACRKSEPTYSGISVIGRNYLPYNMSGFTITDAFGNKASGGGDDPPGAGGGSVKCCYKLKGTEFFVKWNYYDVDQWHKGDKQMFHGETKVSMPQSQLPDEVGSRILEVHFFPDRHVEFQLPGKILDDSSLPIVDVVRWMKQYQAQLDKRYDEREDQQFRRIARIVASAWLKYRLTDRDDLEQYTYFGLLVNSRFDAHPGVQRSLQTAAGQPGAFAKAMQSLPKNVLSALTSNNFEPVTVPLIPDGLLPPPRAEAARHS